MGRGIMASESLSEWLPIWVEMSAVEKPSAVSESQSVSRGIISLQCVGGYLQWCALSGLIVCEII